MSTRSGGRGFATFLLGAFVMLAAVVGYRIWTNRLLYPAPISMSLRLPTTPDLPAPAPMPNPQPVPAPVSAPAD